MGIYNDMIDAKLGRLQLIVTRMRQSQGDVSKLEIDLFLQLLRELYEEGLTMLDCSHDAILGSHDDVVENSDNQDLSDLPFAVDNDFVVPDSVMSDIEEDNNEDLFSSEADDLDANLSLADDSDENGSLSDKQTAEVILEPVVDQIPVDEINSEPADTDSTMSESVSPLDEEPTTVAEPVMEVISESVLDSVSESEFKADALESKDISDIQPDDSMSRNDDDLKLNEPTKQPSLFDFISKKGDQSSDLTLGETLKPTNTDSQNTIGQKVTSRKISDLRDIININDRFNFVNNLFSSNIRAYNECISKLNEMTDKDDALAYVASIGAHYGWSSDSSVVESFYNVIERKF